MGGGVWEGCMPPCTANNAMSCADWSPEECIPSSSQSPTCECRQAITVKEESLASLVD